MDQVEKRLLPPNENLHGHHLSVSQVIRPAPYMPGTRGDCKPCKHSSQANCLPFSSCTTPRSNLAWKTLATAKTTITELDIVNEADDSECDLNIISSAAGTTSAKQWWAATNPIAAGRRRHRSMTLQRQIAEGRVMKKGKDNKCLEMFDCCGESTVVSQQFACLSLAIHLQV